MAVNFPPGTPSTLDPNNKKDANVALSNGNLTVTGNGSANNWVKSTTGRNGKFYVEFTTTTVANTVLGISGSAYIPTYPGADANSFGLFANGSGSLNNTFPAWNVPYASGNVVGMAVDLVLRYVWFRVNGGQWNASGTADPVAGTGPFVLTGYSGGPPHYVVASGDSGSVTTVNFGATAFQTAAPSGFTAWDFAPVVTGQKFQNGNMLFTYDGTKWVASAATKARDFNYFVNPNFASSNQNGTTSGTADGYYWADQWRIMATSACVACCNTARVAALTNYNSPYRGRITTTVALGTVGAGDYYCFYQPMEGNRVMPFAWGNQYAKQVIVRFSLKAPTGTYGCSIRNAAANRSCVFSLVVASGNNNVLVEYVLIVPPDTAGTWVKDSGASLAFTISVVCGTTYQTSNLGFWQNGNFLGPTGSTNGLSSTSNVFDLCDTGMYLDYDGNGLVPPFEVRSEVDSMLESLRYWQRQTAGWGIASAATTGARVGGPLQAPMRIPPTLTLQGAPTLYDGTVNNALTSIATPYSLKYCWEGDMNGTGLTVGRALIMVGSATTGVITDARM